MGVEPIGNVYTIRIKYTVALATFQRVSGVVISPLVLIVTLVKLYIFENANEVIRSSERQVVKGSIPDYYCEDRGFDDLLKYTHHNCYSASND